MSVEGSAPWGTITRVMEPLYPRELRESKARIFVDISGRVDYKGELLDVTYTPGSDDASLIVKSLRGVMHEWRFVPPKDGNCLPADVVIRNRVWFDFDEERPKLSITHVEKPPVLESIKPVTRVDPVFPRQMQKEGREAWVFTKADIGADGSVKQVAARAYPVGEGVDLTPFVRESIRALSQWAFEPAAESASGANRSLCYEFVFRLRG